MTAQPPPAAGEPGPAPDLEYDLAHEMNDSAASPPESEETTPVRVATSTGNYDGDYGYDLAHDVPRSGEQPDA